MIGDIAAAFGGNANRILPNSSEVQVIGIDNNPQIFQAVSIKEITAYPENKKITEPDYDIPIHDFTKIQTNFQTS